MPLVLDDSDQAALTGDRGPAWQLAMRVIVRIADAIQADHLLDISAAHIDSCLYHGRSGLDFADRLADAGARVIVPTTLNVASFDLRHPDLYRGDPQTAVLARRLTERYEEMGCRPTWTCAPYQLEERPEFGQNIAWAESNAIVFANSVLGARTGRYGDFIDICAAITGRAPAAGLHLDDNRRGDVLFRLEGVSDRLLDNDGFYPVLGHLVGAITGTRIPVIEGLPARSSEDRLKTLGAAAASSGSVAMFHAIGSTPEAATFADAFGGRTPGETIVVRPDDLRSTRDQLTTAVDQHTDPSERDSADIGAVCVGTPHYSVGEFGHLVELIGNSRVSAGVQFYASTGRDVLMEIELRGWADRLRESGVTIVTDTCTYITPILAKVDAAMTDSAKWAYYAPGNIGVEVVLGSVEDCVATAVAGHLVRDDSMWADA